MSISYEDALATLQSMFGEPWTVDSLDAVLRLQKGHMENTVDLILRHGDKEPQLLVDQLKAGVNPDDNAMRIDEQLARQLAAGANRTAPVPNPGRGGSVPPASASGRKNRGTPTILADDFLRVPNAVRSAIAMDSDEQLARMLQDELFSEELARNPSFAHLARGHTRATNRGAIPSAGRGAARMGGGMAPGGGAQQPTSPNFLKAVADLGDNAKRRLQMMMAQFNANRNNAATNNSMAGGGNQGGAAAETRGLLDGNDNDMDNMELAARKDL